MPVPPKVELFHPALERKIQVKPNQVEAYQRSGWRVASKAEAKKYEKPKKKPGTVPAGQLPDEKPEVTGTKTSEVPQLDKGQDVTEQD